MKIAVVTGASSGLGKEFVKQISEKYKTIDEIWVLARRVERLVQLSEEINNIKIRPIGCDITNSSELLVYRNMLREYNPSIRILVNAAGYGKIGHFDEIPETESVGMCDLNCAALTRMTMISLPYMQKGKANIINMASAAAFMPQPSFAVYAASKSYVLSFSVALARELKNRGIAVTAVCPGPVATEFFDVAEAYHKSAFYKKLLRAKPERVVALALRDAYHRKNVSVYGITMKMFHVISKLLPHSFMVKFLK